MIYLFLADGFEECEALAPLDILRRAGIQIKTVGIGKKYITGAHGIEVSADITENEIVTDDNLSGVILPGGMPGTLNLERNEKVQKVIDFAAENQLLIAAICAAPSILGHKGLLKNLKATCFTGFEDDLIGAQVVDVPVIRDGNIITAYGAGAAFDFGFEILSYISGNTVSENLKKQMRY